MKPIAQGWCEQGQHNGQLSHPVTALVCERGFPITTRYGLKSYHHCVQPAAYDYSIYTYRGDTWQC